MIGPSKINFLTEIYEVLPVSVSKGLYILTPLRVKSWQHVSMLTLS